MSDDVAIKVEHVSKRYCRSLKRSMLYGLCDITRNMFGLSSYSYRLRRSEFWALDDISFQVKKGETLGIIGPNGAGKTTLLKLLNGIFWPDKGKITVKGRVGALIAVGAGFHPLLTGRENVYLNGAILGMSKKEIHRKFDSIVEFADIGDFLDVPVKHYSSGMFVRLGFAVAAHCDPDILLVDEVLAVGDTAFKRKSSDRMKELIANDDCSIILVSHNMQSIEAIADKAILLGKGRELASGSPGEVISQYDLLMRPQGNTFDIPPEHLDVKDGELALVKKYEDYGDNSVQVKRVWLESSDGECRTQFSGNEDVAVCVSYEMRSSQIVIKRGFVWVAFINEWGVNCMGARVRLGEQGIPELLPQSGTLRAWFRPLQLTSSLYKISMALYDHTFTVPYAHGHYGYIRVVNDIPTYTPGVNTPICWPPCEWDLETHALSNEENVGPIFLERDR